MFETLRKKISFLSPRDKQMSNISNESPTSIVTTPSEVLTLDDLTELDSFTGKVNEDGKAIPVYEDSEGNLYTTESKKEEISRND